MQTYTHTSIAKHTGSFCVSVLAEFPPAFLEISLEIPGSIVKIPLHNLLENNQLALLHF